jgi:tripartite-type tricarboxylate transporter receptor subunit TctC
VVENKTGRRGQHRHGRGRARRTGRIHAAARAGGKPHGHPKLFPNLPFDTQRDLTPVTLLAQSPNVLVVHPSVPAKSFRELVAYAKANPGKLNFASPGDGSGAHLAGRIAECRRGHHDAARSLQRASHRR